jgi:hypothetical protein
MSDAELVAAIYKIIRKRPRLTGIDRPSAEAADLARYDQIVGLMRRHLGSTFDPPRDEVSA